MFIGWLSSRVGVTCAHQKRKTLKQQDVDHTIRTEEILEFLAGNKQATTDYFLLELRQLIGFVIGCFVLLSGPMHVNQRAAEAKAKSVAAAKQKFQKPKATTTTTTTATEEETEPTTENDETKKRKMNGLQAAAAAKKAKAIANTPSITSMFAKA